MQCNTSLLQELKELSLHIQSHFYWSSLSLVIDNSLDEDFGMDLDL